MMETVDSMNLVNYIHNFNILALDFIKASVTWNRYFSLWILIGKNAEEYSEFYACGGADAGATTKQVQPGPPDFASRMTMYHEDNWYHKDAPSREVNTLQTCASW